MNITRSARFLALLTLISLSLSSCASEISVRELQPTGGELADKSTGGVTGVIGGAQGPTGGVSSPPQGGAGTTGGVTAPPGGVTPPPGGTSAPPPPGGQTMEECIPGSLVGPCEQCGLDGQTYEPERDDVHCPSFDCDEYYSFLLVPLEDGRVDCRVQRSTPKESNCQGFGACLNTIEQYCRLGTDESYWDEPIAYNDCQDVIGCSDLTPPEVTTAPAGAPCNGDMGTCDGAGTCVPNTPPVPQDCSEVFDISYNNDNEFCGGEPLADSITCTYYLENGNQPFNPNGGQFSCNQFCESFGALCIGTWNDNNNNHCQERTDNRTCSDQGLDTYVCRCIATEAPPQPQP